MAARSVRRKRHVQQELFRRGGKRRGAGRKPRGPRAGVSHARRPRIKASQVLHVVLRVVSEVGSLRRRSMYHAVREATVTAAMRERIRLVHMSLQGTHIHLLVEAQTREALARGLQGFQVSVARNINTVMGDGHGRRRRGRVFADRYHLTVITTPRQARNVLSYVLSNWRKHGEDQTGPGARWLADPFSSGCMFPDWKELDGKPVMWPLPSTYEPLLVFRPQSWLLREGWKRGGGPISVREVPGPRP